MDDGMKRGRWLGGGWWHGRRRWTGSAARAGRRQAPRQRPSVGGAESLRSSRSFSAAKDGGALDSGLAGHGCTSPYLPLVGDNNGAEYGGSGHFVMAFLDLGASIVSVVCQRVQL